MTNNIIDLRNAPEVWGWSYQEIMRAYSVLGRQFQEYEDVRERIKIPREMDINYTDADNIFISRFWREVKKVNDALLQLDYEIACRGTLIGII